jgi:hypothetical protein
MNKQPNITPRLRPPPGASTSTRRRQLPISTSVLALWRSNVFAGTGPCSTSSERGSFIAWTTWTPMPNAIGISPPANLVHDEPTRQLNSTNNREALGLLAGLDRKCRHDLAAMDSNLPRPSGRGIRIVWHFPGGRGVYRALGEHTHKKLPKCASRPQLRSASINQSQRFRDFLRGSSMPIEFSVFSKDGGPCTKKSRW